MDQTQDPLQVGWQELSPDSSASSDDLSSSDEECMDDISSVIQESSGNTKNFRGGHSPRKNDIFIAVMGITGSGKSSFIAKCSGKKIEIGHSQNSCTSVVDVYPYEVSPDCTVYMIDTPGFDDSDKTDTQVLREIAAWLSDSYQHKILLHGIIYLHRISDIRMQGSARQNLMTFQRLCGTDALRKVILASTMWDITPSEDAVRREAELKETPAFWGWMLEQGSSCHRYNNTADSARQIVLSLTDQKAEILTDIQEQLVDRGLSLGETSAGQSLNSAIRREMRKLAKARKALEEDIKAAEEMQDKRTQEALQQERDRYTVLIQQAEDNTHALKITMENLIAKRDQSVAEMKREIMKLKREKEESIRSVKAKLEREKLKAKNEEQSRQKRAGTGVEDSQKGKHVTYGQSYQNGEVKSPFAWSPFLISFSNSLYILKSPKKWTSNIAKLEGIQAKKAIEFGCMIAGDSKVSAWMARHANGTWVLSKSFAQAYPGFNDNLKELGLENLDICALGPEQQYYARWLDGTWFCGNVSTILVQTIKSLTQRGFKILTISLGYDDSFFITYELDPEHMGYLYDLRRYYRSLERFLEKGKKKVGIQAVTLDPHSQIDYMVVFTENDEDDCEPKYKFHCSNDKTREAVRSWWKASKGIGEL
ncbi:uncharacterized protein B0J16DRAFT_117437 [Fusarium flagelliforme]|uniref:uncharacterized protein n=1 Tax=Fusarium flagelliforme TaxID=2675880 RepID=UPI001E8DA2CF|nr:uncharacterized protein B0J16DRAFT_117437 [Fusarium flagelliforme]KAH7189594.1 hypothetical protein B0J16DRAFT_117437 [Fusarium flagelliforme]